MSRWSAERVRVGFGADRVDAVRLGFGLPRRLARSGGAGFAPRDTGGAGFAPRDTGGAGFAPRDTGGAGFAPREGEPAWRAALDALDAALEPVARRGDRVAVVLANRWLRYAVLPWHDEVTGAAEVEQLARLQFEPRYGAAVADWAIRACDGGWGRPHLACAADRALIDALRERLEARGLTLGSVQPLLMAAFNDERRRLGDDAAFAIVEPDRLCLALIDGGRWREVASRRAGADAPRALEQELAALGVDGDAMRVDVLLVGEGAAWPEVSEREAREAPGPPAQAMRPARPTRILGARALALCGAA